MKGNKAMKKKGNILEELFYSAYTEGRGIIEPKIWKEYQELTEQFNETESDSPEETHLLNRLEQMKIQHGQELDEYLHWSDYMQDKYRDILGENNKDLIEELYQCDNMFEFLKRKLA